MLQPAVSVPGDDWREAMFGCERWLGQFRPETAAQALRAAADALSDEERVDRYGEGPIVSELERQVADLLGKEAALLFPSGTMAQTIALRIHCDARGTKSIAFHPTCHLELFEQAGYVHLHTLAATLVGHRDALITLSDLEALSPPLGAVLLELPQREIGGQLPGWEDMCAQVAAIRERGAAVHLDGARIWQVAPFYGRSYAEISALFDTVYVSLYKDLAGLAGAVLAGPAGVIEQARVWRRRHGGTLPRLFPLVAAARPGFAELLPQMDAFCAHARAVAAALREVPGVDVVPDPPQTPMFHLHLRGEGEALFDRALAVAREQRVWILPALQPTAVPGVSRAEITIGEPALAISPAEAADLLARIVGGPAADS
jgi:threonine aldolase